MNRWRGDIYRPAPADMLEANEPLTFADLCYCGGDLCAALEPEHGTAPLEAPAYYDYLRLDGRVFSSAGNTNAARAAWRKASSDA